MTKEIIKIYLETADKKALISKASETGFFGRGAISHFLSFVARNDIIFLDDNCKKMLRTLDLK